MRTYILQDFKNTRNLVPELIQKLDALESKIGEQIYTSGFRLGDPKSHGKGLAVDISATDSRSRFNILKALIEIGFTRIGVYPRHIHADIDDSRDLRVIWYGKYNKN